MFMFMIGYFMMGLIFLIIRFFYHILSDKNSGNNLVQAIKKDFFSLCSYVNQIIVSNPKKIKFILIMLVILIILPMTPIKLEIEYIIEDFFCMIMFFTLVVIFAPKENHEKKGFPVEIFGFIYSIIYMYYSSGVLVFDFFYALDSLNKMYAYGYIITLISYIICIATLSRFMERELAKHEIILLGIIMLTTLEFITYYGIGFFGNLKYLNYDPSEYVFNIFNIFGDITTIINQGIFIASQSQILERSTGEIWGYVILNGTDVLTVTVVLGYLVQKFMEK